VRELRAKYLDWCSAQVADHFLAMSPDEIFEIAERAAQSDAEVGGRPLSASEDGMDADGLTSYRRMVERVTGVLTDQIDLPGFDEWLDLYRNRPAEVEEQLLGFWKEAGEQL
jgi:hypothetical protein